MEPLPSQMRPERVEDFVGQTHLTAKDGPLAKAIAGGHLFSFILWGPPGSGKTTLARIYANSLDARLYELSAVSAGKKDIEKIVAEDAADTAKVLFLDEIHRFNKAQQDFLLPYVESGVITLIGATTENPSFEVIPPLLSRAKIFTLEAFSEDELEQIVRKSEPKISHKALAWLYQASGADARQALSMIENVKSLYGTLSVENLKKTLQTKQIGYDKAGDEHYNTISAFIKSMRAGQADAALYYLARMVEAGEDPKFIARRMVIFASEDVGLAQPTALVVANEVFRAVETIGYPECAINLAHGVAYLANAEKSRASYDAYNRAVADVREHGSLSIPLHIRNAPTQLMKDQGYGKGYEMYDDESYLPEKLKGKRYLDKNE